MLDLKMQTFLMLCKERNYRKTAERLNMTQPAVTQHIQYLERHYGCKLFNYDRRELHITESGIILRDYAQRMQYIEKNLVNDLIPDSQVFLRIGATKTIGQYVLSDHVTNYLAEQENHLSVEVENTTVLLQQLDQGTLDFAIVEGLFDKGKYDSRCYQTWNFIGICAKNHRFAHKRIPLSEVLKETLILREQGSGTRQILEGLLTSFNHAPKDFRDTIEINNFALITRLIENHVGITFAYHAVAKNNPLLAVFEIEDAHLSFDFNYVYLKDDIAHRKVDYFAQYAEQPAPVNE